jgi:hypothetical protein
MANSSRWSVQMNGLPSRIPENVMSRYPWIPQDVIEFACEVKQAISADEKAWLLTAFDYTGESDSSFMWNEWELQSIEAAGEDEEWVRQIRRFWDDHLPIYMSVRDGYEYYALIRGGEVVRGREPEFEETENFAQSFERFLEYVISVG